MKSLRILALCIVTSTSMLMAQAPAAAPSQPAPAKAKAPAAPPPSAADIADAKAKGLVWVNLNSKVYHQAGVSQYGATKHGKFMTEADAKAAGYRAAQDTPATKKAKPDASKK